MYLSRITGACVCIYVWVPKETWKVVNNCHMVYLIIQNKPSESIRACKGVFAEASQDANPHKGVHTPPHRLLQPNPGKLKWSRAKECKRWGKAGNEPMKLSHIQFSSHWAAVLTCSSTVSFDVCISSSKLLPPGEKGEEDAMKQVFAN